MDYHALSVSEDTSKEQPLKLKREDGFMFGRDTHKPDHKRADYRATGHAKSVYQAEIKANHGEQAEEISQQKIKPKLICVLRFGPRPRKAVRMLLSRRNAASFDALLADLTQAVRLDSGAVRRYNELGS